MRIRRAERRDLPQVETLLKKADLPALAPHPLLSNVLVAELEGKIAAAAVLDVFARSGLLRTIVVAPDQRRRGLGREIFRSLLARAHELSLKQLYVVASREREFFAALGFEAAPPDDVPLALREARPDREIPAADLMELRLR